MLAWFCSVGRRPSSVDGFFAPTAGPRLATRCLWSHAASFTSAPASPSPLSMGLQTASFSRVLRASCFVRAPRRLHWLKDEHKTPPPSSPSQFDAVARNEPPIAYARGFIAAHHQLLLPPSGCSLFRRRGGTSTAPLFSSCAARKAAGLSSRLKTCIMMETGGHLARSLTAFERARPCSSVARLPALACFWRLVGGTELLLDAC